MRLFVDDNSLIFSSAGLAELERVLNEAQQIEHLGLKVVNHIQSTKCRSDGHFKYP